MIECDYFYDENENGFNARVQDHPEINASSAGHGSPLGSMEQMLDILTGAWNAAFPGDPKTPADFHMNDAPPWRDGPEDIHDVRMPNKPERDAPEA